MSLVVASPKEPESEEKPQKSLNEKQQVSSTRYKVMMDLEFLLCTFPLNPQSALCVQFSHLIVNFFGVS